MKTTKRGIFLNLTESEYYLKYKGLVFYFSSQFYKKKFTENIDEFLKDETIKLQVKYNININLDILFMIAFYKKTEKRGFRIYDEINQKEISSSCGIIGNILMY